MGEAWEGGKGDKPRISDGEKYRQNYDNIFRKKSAHDSWSEYSDQFIKENPDLYDQDLDKLLE